MTVTKEMVTTNGSKPAALPIPIPSGNNSLFLDIAVFEQSWRIAGALAKAKMIPKIYQGSISDCMICLELAHRLGESPLVVMQNTYPLHGKMGFFATFVIAKLNTCGLFSPIRFIYDGKVGTDQRACRVVTTYLETDEKLEGPIVSIAMAKADGWFGKDGSKWKSLPEMMLSYRAAAFFGRLYAPHLMMGMRTVDELEDIGPAPGELIESTAGIASTVEGMVGALDVVDQAAGEAVEQAELDKEAKKKAAIEKRKATLARKKKEKEEAQAAEAAAADAKTEGEPAAGTVVDDPETVESDTSEQQEKVVEMAKEVFSGPPPGFTKTDPPETIGTNQGPNTKPPRQKELVSQTIIAISEIVAVKHLENWMAKHLNDLMAEKFPNQEDQDEIRRFASAHMIELKAAAKKRVEDKIIEAGPPETENPPPPTPDGEELAMKETGEISAAWKFTYRLKNGENAETDPAVPAPHLQLAARKTGTSQKLDAWRFQNFKKFEKELNADEMGSFMGWVGDMYNQWKGQEEVENAS